MGNITMLVLVASIMLGSLGGNLIDRSHVHLEYQE